MRRAVAEPGSAWSRLTVTRIRVAAGPSGASIPGIGVSTAGIAVTGTGTALIAVPGVTPGSRVAGLRVASLGITRLLVAGIGKALSTAGERRGAEGRGAVSGIAISRGGGTASIVRLPGRRLVAALTDRGPVASLTCW
jgi:hypothetical protein